MYLCENLHYVYENERLNPIYERRERKWQSEIRSKHPRELHQKQAKSLVMDATVRKPSRLLAVL